MKNALEILKKRAERNPKLQEAYIEEKKNFQIGCQIREYRERANMSQSELAELIGSKQSVISRLENANYQGHTISLLKKIAKAVGVPLVSFFGPSENSKELTKHVPAIMKMKKPLLNFICNPKQIMTPRQYAR